MNVDSPTCPSLPAVLAVDDQKVQLRLLTALLMNQYHVYTATSGIEAIRFLEEMSLAKMVYCLHAILLDVSMPDLNGLAVTELIRIRFPEIPIIICSGYNEKDIILDAKKRGASDYLVKPYRQDVLLHKLQKCAQRLTHE